MTVSHVYILANGEQERLRPVLDMPKQHLLVPRDAGFSEALIERTARQVEEHLHTKPRVVAPDTLLWRAACKAKNLWHFPVARTGNSILDTIQQLLGGFDAPTPSTVFLLGDVVFSRATMQLIARARTEADRVRFVGRLGASLRTGKQYGEIFALIVPTSRHKQTYDLLQATMLHVLNAGRLWDFYSRVSEGGSGRNHFLSIDPTDFTDDIDTPEDVEIVLPKLREAIAHEGGF